MKKFIAILTALLIVSSAFANLNFYAHVRTGMWYQMYDKDYNVAQYGVKESRTDLDYSLFGCSRFGATFTDENYKFNTEFGISSSNVSLRHIYGEYKFENFSLLVGQTWTGFSELADQAIDGDNGLIGRGAFCDGRLPQIGLKINGGYVLLMQPNKTDPLGIGQSRVDALLPKINVGYKYNNNGLYVHPSFGINMSNYNEDFSGNDEAVTAIVFSLTGKYTEDMLDFTGQLNFGQNAGNYGIIGAWHASDNDEGEVVNAITTSGFGQLGYKMNEKAKLNVGLGVMSQEYDVKDFEEYTISNLYVHAKIALAKNVWITPELGLINYGEVGKTKYGTRTYFGSKFEMRFSN